MGICRDAGFHAVSLAALRRWSFIAMRDLVAAAEFYRDLKFYAAPFAAMEFYRDAGFRRGVRFRIKAKF